MQRIKTLVLACLAVFALSAVASASASAAECPTEKGGEATYCVEESAGKFSDGPFAGAVAGKNASTTIGLHLRPTEKIQCTSEASSASLSQPAEENGTTSKMQIKLSGCTLAGFPHCVVEDSQTLEPGTIQITSLRSKLQLIGGTIYSLIEGETGRALVTIHVHNKGVETCNQSVNFTLFGTICGEASKALNVSSILKLSGSIAEACKSKLEGIGFPTYFEGESAQEFTGTLKGDRWAVTES